MKKTLLVLLIAIFISALFGTTNAFAGGWFRASGSDAVGDLIWNSGAPETNPTSTVSPHLGFSTTSNQCRVCHAVHAAGDSSFRLLKDGSVDETRSPGEGSELGMGNKPATECMYCHDADSGASSLRPYGMLFGTTVRGEHSMGATWIPDSSVNDGVSQADGKGVLPGSGAVPELGCYQCHSVHGAKILTDIVAFGWGETQPIDNYILRKDPAGNGGDANTGINSILAPWDSSDSASQWRDGRSKDTTLYPVLDTTPYLANSIWKYEVQIAWCGDCHNENPNITGPGDFRPNGSSHPLFGGKSTTDSSDPLVGGWMDVLGTTVQVSGGSPKGCAQCHLSNSGTSTTETVSWPHQAEGIKFLGFNTTDHPLNPATSFYPYAEGGKSGPGDSDRVVPGMDKVCLWCHIFDKQTVPKGVGITF